MRKAFTLAETLIVIAIIGVIATLTLPNVMANYKKKVYVAQLQKAYNQLSNATQQLMVDENTDTLKDTYLFGGNNDYAKFLKKYFKTVKTCDNSDYKECLAETYKNINSENVDIENFTNWGNFICGVTNTGAAICIQNQDSKNKLVIIDVNGKDGPNVYGRDLFDMFLKKNGDITADIWASDRFNEFGCQKGQIYDGAGCFGRIQSSGWKMDY